LTDVSLTDLADNDILQYNSSTEKWENVQDLTIKAGQKIIFNDV